VIKLEWNLSLFISPIFLVVVLKGVFGRMLLLFVNTLPSENKSQPQIPSLWVVCHAIFAFFSVLCVLDTCCLQSCTWSPPFNKAQTLPERCGGTHPPTVLSTENKEKYRQRAESLQPHSCMPPQTSQAALTVYIHVFETWMFHTHLPPGSTDLHSQYSFKMCTQNCCHRFSIWPNVSHSVPESWLGLIARKVFLQNIMM